MPQTGERPVPTQTGDDDQAKSPADLGRAGLKESVRRAVKEFKDDRATLTAAGMAFYWFLAIFPAMLALVGFLGLFNLSQAGLDSVIKTIRSALPGQAATTLTDAIGQATESGNGSSLVAALIGVALALWGASAGMVAMQMGLDVAYDVPQDRKFLKKRLVGLALVLVAAVLGGIATALIVFGAPIGESLSDDFGSAFGIVWTILRWVGGIAALTLLFATFYYLAPNRETPRWVWVSPGGVLAVLIWLAASIGFSFYVSSFGKYAETYGSLAGVVILLLWLYLSAIAVVMGGELNAELERQSAVQAGQVPHPDTDPGAACDDPSPEPPAPPAETAGTAETTTVRSTDSSDLQSAWAREARR